MHALLFIVALRHAALTTALFHFESGPQQVHLLELFTADGCAKCPTAEVSFGNVRDDPGLWKHFVPVTWQVKVMGEGVRMPFTSDVFTQRQLSYAEIWHMPSVYTPCFVLDGSPTSHGDWLPSAQSLGPDSVGSLTADNTGDGRVHVTFKPIGQNSRGWKAWVALLGREVESRTRSGENPGKEARHHFVVLDLNVSTMRRAEGAFAVDLPLGQASSPAAGRGIAVWVSPGGDAQVPIQATGGLLE